MVVYNEWPPRGAMAHPLVFRLGFLAKASVIADGPLLQGFEMGSA